jgi:hypothetical protein
MNALSHTGTSALLEELSPYLNDSLVNELLPRQRGAGRRRAFSSAQLLRVLLLALLTPAHHFNLLVKLSCAKPDVIATTLSEISAKLERRPPARRGRSADL